MQRIKRKKLIYEPSLDMLYTKDQIVEPMDFVEGPVPERDPTSVIIDSVFPGILNDHPENFSEITVDEDGGVHVEDIYVPPGPKPVLASETNGPRLIISQIEVENFKSYAIEQILGPFHQSFTAIVGPNGSGKSNVIDAMLFVFGYRSSKIRSKKISELIHSSSNFLNVTSAKVSVHFCEIIDEDEDNYSVVPDSEIVVTRRAFKDNTSYYTVNGTRMQFKQVAQLLRQKGIDLDHNRFLILQGEIEEIALMKPKGATEHETGMLEYLEDIIGSSRFKEPLGMLLAKVDELNELRKSKLNRVRLLELEKVELMPAMEESVRLVNLTNEALRTRNLLIQKYMYETAKIIQKKNDEYLELKDKVEKINDKQQTLQRTLAEKNAVLEAGMQKYNLLRTKKSEVAERLKNTKRRLDHIQSSTAQAKKKKKTSEQALEEKRRKLVDLELVPEKNQKESEDCKKLLDKHKVTIENLKEEHRALTVNIRNQTKELDENESILKSQLKVINKELEAAKTQVKIAETKLNTYLSTEADAVTILEQLKQNYGAATKALEEKTKSQPNLEKSRISLEKELQETQNKLQALRDEEMTISMKVRTLAAQLEESVQNMNAHNRRNEVLNKIMEQKRNGRITGIYGRLGDLGSIDAKYDVAISTACSGLENILVDNEHTGQMCIEYLKTINSRSNFLVLDKQDHLKSVYPRKVNYPENVPRLFDLVRVKDERVKQAFYYALRDTLVATDIDQATRIAYGSKRYRVVTLKGELIELSGTMSGGGRTVMRGRMSTSVREDTTDPRLIEQQTQELQASRERMNQITDEQRQLTTNMSTLQTNFRQTRDRLRIEEEEIKSLKLQITNLKNDIQEQERKAAASKVNPRERAAMEATLKTAQEKMHVAAGKYEKLEQEVNDVQMQISSVTGSTLDTVNKKIKELSTLIDKISTELRKLETATNNSKKEASKLKVEIGQLEKHVTELVASLESFSNEKKERTLEDQQLQKEIEELDEMIKEGSGEFGELQEEIQKLTSKDTKYRSEKLELNVAAEKKLSEIKDSRRKLPVFKNELRSLILEDPKVNEIPDFETPEPLEIHSDIELEVANIEELREKWSIQHGRLEGAKPNIQAILDYKEKDKIYLARVIELDEITSKRNKMRELYESLRKRRTADFLAGFNTITAKLKEMYQMITLGGDAELELVDSLDPFTEGITFSVRPPQKSWKNISNISGGERTLSSLALVFALHYYKPTPLYVMDEIDAALDFKNVSIVANYIKERTRNAQFVIISLRYNMFEVSNRLVGIYKTDDHTKCVVIDNNSSLNLPEFAREHHLQMD